MNKHNETGFNQDDVGVVMNGPTVINTTFIYNNKTWVTITTTTKHGIQEQQHWVMMTTTTLGNDDKIDSKTAEQGTLLQPRCILTLISYLVARCSWLVALPEPA